MERICQLVIFLIFLNIFKVSCEGGSLTFVIDDTTSMDFEINSVLKSADKIANAVFNDKSSAIKNMVVVTVNDPGTYLRVVTENRDEFKRVMAAIHTWDDDNWKCLEPLMKGLIQALENSLPGSYIYVFTDASASDPEKSAKVKQLCQQKQSQIIFILTGYCESKQDPNFQIFYDVADACSGLAFFAEKYEIDQVISTIEDTIKGNKALLKSTTVPAEKYTDVRFQIDDQTEYATISATGSDVKLTISGPEAKQQRTMWMDHGKVIKLLDPTPGEYVASVKSTSKTSVVIFGRTDFSFTYGFSGSEPKSSGDTSSQPIANNNVYLALSVTDEEQAVNIISAQILNKDNSVIIDQLPLRNVSKNFYITKPFVAPSHDFKVAIKGIVKATGNEITRISKIPIKPQEPEKNPDTMAPTVSIVEGKTISIDYNSTLKLTCKVKAYPKPEITWMDSKGNKMESLSSLVQDPYDYISYLELSQAVKGENFTCFAVNELNTNNDTTSVVLKSFPPKISGDAKWLRVIYGHNVNIKCYVDGIPAPTVQWFANNTRIETTNTTNSKDHGLRLAAHLTDTGYYTCKASNSLGTVNNTVHLQVYVPVYIEIPRSSKIEILVGNHLFLPCNANGYPMPEVKWTFQSFDPKIPSTDIPSIGSSVALRSIQLNQQGNYTCFASNSISGSASITYEVNVRAPPTIDNHYPEKTFEVVEGDLVLRIQCNATGSPKPTILWKKDGLNITLGTKFDIEEDGTLIIKNIDDKSQGTYMCQAQNKMGQDTEVYNVIVNKFPKERFISTIFVAEGETIELKCGIPHTDTDFLRWYKDGHIIKIGELKLQSVGKHDAGLYSCRVSNFEKSRSMHVKVDVDEEFQPTFISDAEENIDFYLDNVAYLDCEANGVPKPKVTWKHNGKIIDGITEMTYPVEMKFNTRGVYECEVSNRCGSIHRSFKITSRGKVVQDLSSSSSLVIVQVNVPDLSPSEANNHVLCNDICSDVDWMNSTNWNNVEDGFTYCCTLSEFETAFGYKGRFNKYNKMNNVLFGVSLIPEHYLT